MHNDPILPREQPGDVDINGYLATALFVGVIVLLMILIFALASAA